MDVRAAPACLLLLVLPPALCHQTVCPASSATSIHFWASSYRNMSGHWISEAAVTRTASEQIVGQQAEKRSWRYAVDFTRYHCAEQDSLTTTFHVEAPPPRVGPDYTYYHGIGYYKLHTTKLSWEDARRACSAEGAHLAIVNSEAEENAIREVMRRYSKDNFAAFIGFHDMFKEGEYVTVFGEPLSSTGRARWAPSEPNNVVSTGSPEGEDCGNIYLDGTINDARCSLQLVFVCEQSI